MPRPIHMVRALLIGNEREERSQAGSLARDFLIGDNRLADGS